MSQSHEASLPEGIDSFQLISWDSPSVQTAYNQPINAAQSEASGTCLLYAARKETGA